VSDKSFYQNLLTNFQQIKEQAMLRASIKTSDSV